MSLTEILIKVVGVLLLLAGLDLILTSLGAGIFLSLTFISPIISFIVGIILIGVGITIIRNGRLSL